MIVLVLSCLFLITSINGAELEIYKKTVTKLNEFQASSFNVWFKNVSEPITTLVEMNSSSPDHLAIIGNGFLLFFPNETERGLKKSVDVLAGPFGYSIVTIGANSSDVNSVSFKVRIVREKTVIDTIFMIILIIFLVINNFFMGCVLDLAIIKQVFRKPVGPLIGLCCQFTFMPLASYGFAFAFFDSLEEALGLFALGCSPGGTGSNFWTLLFDADINLSVVMTFVSTVAALAMMPLWLFTLGQHFLTDIQIPFNYLIYTLIGFVFPVIIGILGRSLRPRLANTIAEKILKPFTVFLLIILLTFGIYANFAVLKLITWKIIVAGMCVAWGGYLFGAAFASMFCLKIPQIIAISIETAQQNPGIAFLVLQLSLPQPDADFASVAPAAQLLVTGLPLWIVYIIYCIRQWKKNKGVEEIPSVDIEVSKPKNKSTEDLWISVKLRDDDEEETRIISAMGDAEGEDVVWQRS